jgi:hypothetical protein
MNGAERFLPEFYLDKHDSGALASLALTALSANGHVWVLFVVCALFIAATLALVAARARLLGLEAGSIAAVVALVVLSFSGRAGAGFDAAAWCFAALLLLVADAGERYKWYLPVIVAAWSILLDSGTIGAVLIVLRVLDKRGTALVASACALASLLSANGFSLAFHGGRALYFDMLLGGADRQPLWSFGATLPAIALWAIVVFAAAGGIARKSRTGEAAVFLAFLVSAVLDARMAPFFAIAVAPPLFARYRSIAIPLRAAAPIMALCVAAAIATPVRSDAGPAALLASVARDHRAHRVVCVRPAWCNPVLDLQPRTMTALAIGIPEVSNAKDRLLQKHIADDSSEIVEQMKAAHADTLIAAQSMGAASLLAMHGWRIVAREPSGYRFAVQQERTP